MGTSHRDKREYNNTDHLGTPTLVFDETGASVWEAVERRPFGEVTDEGPGIIEMNVRFPGQYLDRESGLHYNYWRFYDPATGRYVRSDPIGL